MKIIDNVLRFIKKFWKIILVIAIIIIAIILYKYISNYLYDKKYKQYELKMHIYGFDTMYNNSSAASRESVTKSEAIKMIISSVYNKYDISGFAYETTDKYDNAIWVKYAEEQKIISANTITAENENTPITYQDAIQYYINARVILLNKALTTDKKASFSDMGSYSTDIQTYINDAVSNDLIENTKGKLNAKNNITKGQLNELVVKFVEKYNTITLSGDKINIDPNNVPSNSSDYPYTLFNVDKSIYEKAFVKDEDYAADFKNPIDIYIKEKDNYAQIKEKAENYYNYILNIDYNSINIDDFKKNISQYSMYSVYDSDIENYIDYVKKNRIKISGTAKAQLPIVYYDGKYIRIRLKLIFKIDTSDTKENLLYGDLSNKQKNTYSDNNNILIDAQMGVVSASKEIFINMDPISSMIIK